MATDFRTLWQEALPWSAFFAPDMELRPLWEGVYRNVTLPEWAVAAAAKVPGLKFLVITEDWCGDAVNTLPIIARVAEASPLFSLRVLPRDMSLDIMDRHLTAGARAIPIVIIYDEEFAEHYEFREGKVWRRKSYFFRSAI